VTVTLTVNMEAGGTPPLGNLQIAAYRAPFVAGDIGTAARYLGDPGVSSGSPPTVQSFQATIPANTDYDLVVFSANANLAGVGSTYTLTVAPGNGTCTLTGVLGTAPSGNNCTTLGAESAGLFDWINPATSFNTLLNFASVR